MRRGWEKNRVWINSSIVEIFNDNLPDDNALWRYLIIINDDTKTMNDSTVNCRIQHHMTILINRDEFADKARHIPKE